MLNSRKLHFALALIGLLIVSAASSFAQPFNCIVGSNTLALRPSGITEVTGDIAINCTSYPTTPVTLSIQLSGPITNINYTGTTLITAPVTTAVATALVTPGTAPDFVGGVINTALPNTINFSIPATAGGATVIQIQNIRVDATKVAPGATITANILGSTGTQFLTLNPNPTQVGIVLQGDLSASIVGGNNATSGSAAAQTVALCAGNSGGQVRGILRFREVFPSIFRQASNEGVGATTGTQLRTILANLSSGVLVYAPNTAFTSGGNLITPVSGISASSLDETLSGFSEVYTPATGDTAYTGTWGQVTGDFSYQISTDNLNTTDTVHIPLIVRVPSSAASGAATAVLGLGPSDATGFPRFIAPSMAPGNVLATAPCSTSLLFPYVTNVSGFDTGLAIMNTTLDPPVTDGTSYIGFGTGNQNNGGCRLSFYGRNVEDAAAPAPSAILTGTIAAGKLFAYSLLGGGDGAAPLSRTGFQGYVIAQCNFQLAHGYAFISDVGAKSIAHGYLALVIGTPAGGSRTSGATIEALNN